MFMFKVFITASAKKSAKKLPKEIRQNIIDKSKKLKINPYLGEKLSGSLHFLYSFHFKIKGVQYRLAYTINKPKKLIVVHLISKREGFYNRLKMLFR